MEQIYAVILAGGSGTRFWPKSRKRYPKQLCQIGSQSQTMIEQTLHRIDGFIEPSKRMIVTHKDQAQVTAQIVKTLAPVILKEPQAKNTAAALAMAAFEIAAKHKNSNETPIMISLHADHVIDDPKKFVSCLKEACLAAKEGYLTLVGMVPSYPETGYGYIEKGPALPFGHSLSKVLTFREKPNHETASKYIATKKFLWNSGLFVWSIPTILNELEKFLPHTFHTLKNLITKYDSFLNVPEVELAEAYKQLENTPIDQSVLEKSDRVAVVDGSFNWQDVGSWSALSECFPTDEKGNLVFGDAVLLDSTGVTVDSDGPLVAGIGLKDLVVVCHKGAILVCPKDRSQDVKKIVTWLESNDRSDLL